MKEGGREGVKEGGRRREVPSLLGGEWVDCESGAAEAEEEGREGGGREGGREGGRRWEVLQTVRVGLLKRRREGRLVERKKVWLVGYGLVNVMVWRGKGREVWGDQHTAHAARV